MLCIELLEKLLSPEAIFMEKEEKVFKGHASLNCTLSQIYEDQMEEENLLLRH